MGAFLDGGAGLNGGGGDVGPGHGEGDDDEKGVEFVRVGDAGVFDVEAPGFAVAKQAFDLPPFPVDAEGLVGGSVGGDDQELIVGEAFGWCQSNAKRSAN